MTGDPHRHSWLRALGREPLPEQLDLGGTSYRIERVFKHDFFAATGLYTGDAGRVVLKVARTARLFVLPMRWLGRILAQHEARLYRHVGDLDGIPRFLGEWGETGFVHEYLEGRPLQPRERVADDFFDRLHALVSGLHARRVAYADLEKNENILVDARGRPALIDFQISWHWPLDPRERRGVSRFLPQVLGKWILESLQASDLYHLQKHRRRHRRDQMTAEEIARSYVLRPSILWHRRITGPFQRVRRRVLLRLTGNPRSPRQEGAEFFEHFGCEGSGRVDTERSAIPGKQAR